MGAHEPKSPGLTSDEPAQSEPGGVWQEFEHIPFRPEVKMRFGFWRKEIANLDSNLAR